MIQVSGVSGKAEESEASRPPARRRRRAAGHPAAEGSCFLPGTAGDDSQFTLDLSGWNARGSCLAKLRRFDGAEVGIVLEPLLHCLEILLGDDNEALLAIADEKVIFCFDHETPSLGQS